MAPFLHTKRRYADLVRSLIAVLLFSVVVPCGLFEANDASVCTTEDVRTGGAAGDHADGLHLDCCAGCLTCCASYTASSVLRPLAPAPAVALHVFSLEQGPPKSPLPIWRPPRL